MYRLTMFGKWNWSKGKGWHCGPTFTPVLWDQLRGLVKQQMISRRRCGQPGQGLDIFTIERVAVDTLA